MRARPTSASPPSARQGAGIGVSAVPVSRCHGVRPRCASPKRVRRSSAIKIRPPSAASAMIASGIRAQDELRQRPEGAAVAEVAGRTRSARTATAASAAPTSSTGWRRIRASARGTSTNSASTVPAPSSASGSVSPPSPSADGQRGHEQRARDGGDAPGRIGEHVHRLRFGRRASTVSASFGASPCTARPCSRSMRCLVDVPAPCAARATRAAAASPRARGSPVVSGRSSRIDRDSRASPGASAGRRRPGSRARRARRPSWRSRSPASARAVAVAVSALVASSSVARRTGRRPSGVGVARLRLAERARLPTRSAERRSCWSTRDVHAAVVRERDQRAPHARLDPQRDRPARRQRACGAGRAVSRPRPLRVRLRGSSASVRGATTRACVLGSTRSPPTASADATAARARRSAAAPRPGRAGPARERADEDRAGERDDHPAEAEHRRGGAGARQRREADQRAAGLGQQDDAALPAAVLALGREDQPRGDVHEHAEAEQDAAEREPQPHACRRERPSARPGRRRRRRASGRARGRVIGVGSPSSIAMHCRTARRAFTSRDGPERVSGISRRAPVRMTAASETTSCSAGADVNAADRCARASTRRTRSGTASRRSCSSRRRDARPAPAARARCTSASPTIRASSSS